MVAAAPGPSQGAAPRLAAEATRPNVVVVMADDMRADDVRFMPAVRGLLAATGLNFRNSFSPYPLCCPARASFLSGQYSHNHRVYSHVAPWGFQSLDDRATLATALQAGGYNTGFVGKYLNGYGSQRSLVTGRSSFTYVPNGWTDWYGAPDRPPGSRYTSGGTYNYFHTLFNINGRIQDRWRGDYQTNVLGSFSRQLVTKYHRSAKPFFLWVNPVAPHHGGREVGDPKPIRRTSGAYTRLVTPARPRWVRGRFDSTVRRAPGLPVDGSSPEADVSDKPSGMRYGNINAAERVGMLAVTRQRAEALYVLDQEVRRLIATLKSTGEFANTVFVFTSDNGYFLGEHRMRQGKIKPHEPSVRVPLLMAGRGIPHGERFDPVTTPGLTATVADLAGVTDLLPVEGDGVSVVPSIQQDQGWTVPVVVEAVDFGNEFPRDPAAKAPGFTEARNTIGVRTARWKLVRYSNGETELYDLDQDPNELTNVAADPAHAAELELLQQAWLDYKDCAGAGCRASMSEALQRDAASTRAATDEQSRLVRAVFGTWR